MKYLRFIFDTHRFSFFDATFICWACFAVHDHQYAKWIAIIVVGIFISLIGERVTR